MKLISTKKKLLKPIILLLLHFFSYSLEAQNEKITINFQNISLQEAFTQIEKMSGFSIAYAVSGLDLKKEVSADYENIDVEEAVGRVLFETGQDFALKKTGYHILILSPAKELQTPVQVIRGVVKEYVSGKPIADATVGLLNMPALGAITDSLGTFIIKNVSVGRHDLKVTYVGYKPEIVYGILLTSSKEAIIEISLKEQVEQLSEIIIRPGFQKEYTVNRMAITGGRMLSMEEASRFANGFDDPARLVSGFAGVAGDVASNAIAVRGNSPMFTQWRLEGIEIPNPTHFADLSGLGGGFLTALSSQVTGNSDFYNGAFPAEYGNALGGVFDIRMRNGNTLRHEHTFQVGLLGIDLGSEGPINRDKGSSYIFNYRFSTTSLASGNEINMKYQDLSFKLNFPSKRTGTFSLWGLGLIDRNKSNAEPQEDWETLNDRQKSINELEKLAGGFTHSYQFNNSTSLKSTLSATYASDHSYADQMTYKGNIITVGDIRNNRWNIVFNSYLDKRFNSTHTNRTGITVTGLLFDLDYNVSPDFGLEIPMTRISKGKGNSTVTSFYSTSLVDLTKNLQATVGVNAQYFALNNNWSIEPRLALKWQVSLGHSLAVAYGLHSRREKLDYYFVEKEGLSNRFLDFSRAHHTGITYNWNVRPGMNLKVETYYQYLFSIPVEKNSSFSIINYQDYYLDRLLVNQGKGMNYGIEATLERYLSDGYYYMITGSLFKSRYKGGDHIWRNSRLDRGYIFNFLAGKEWMIGKNKQNMFSINGRVFYHGGDRYTPIDREKSLQHKDIYYDESKAYSLKQRPVMNGDFSVSYKINKRKLSHEFSLKILNVGSHTGILYYEYDEKHQVIKEKKAYGIIPNLTYKIQF